MSKRLAKKTDARIFGLDLSADMLKQGELNVRRANLTERIALVQGRGEQLPFADASFDAMTFTYLLRYVADPQAALTELALDLRWAWNHAADDLWRQLDPDLWASTGNAWFVLQTVSKEKLQAAGADPEFQRVLSQYADHDSANGAARS